jgi:hypothetical protein
MPKYLPALQTGAQEFLRNTNKAYDECSRGIAELDRIIVSVAANRADATRAYLIPILYAYWERFFRTSFAEYVRVLSNVAILFIDSHIPLTLVRLRREFSIFAKESNVGRIHELSDRYTCAELALLLEEFADWINGPVTFRDPESWVDTEGNVQFGVLEKNCRNIGLEVDRLKAAIQHNKSLFQGLKDLVDKRNSIAHGEVFEPVSQKEWEAVRSFVLDLLNVLQDELYQHLQDPGKVQGSVPLAVKPNSAIRPGQFC